MRIKIFILVLILCATTRVTGQVSERDMFRSELEEDLYKEKFLDNISSERTGELKNWDYELGKTMTSLDGNRIRVEKYVKIPSNNEVDFYVLNSNGNGELNIFKSKYTFNKALPADFSSIVKQTSIKLHSTSPEYYLTSYEEQWTNGNDTLSFKKENATIATDAEGKYYVDFQTANMSINETVVVGPIDPVEDLTEDPPPPPPPPDDDPPAAGAPLNEGEDEYEEHPIEREVVTYGDTTLVLEKKGSTYELEVMDGDFTESNINLLNSDAFSELDSFLSNLE